MKAIINWIVLIPVLVLAVGAEFFTSFSPEGAKSFFGKDVNGVSEIIIFALIGLFVLLLLFSLFDRKTSPVHLLKKNYAAGVSAVIAAFALAGDTAAGVAEGLRGSGLGTMDVLVMVVSAFAAVALLLAGINHCSGVNTKNNSAFLYLSVPLWCGVHLLSRFMSHTATPVSMSETLDLVMYVFMAIYFMYSFMVVSLINGKNPVKAAIYWGAPAAVSALVYSASIIGTNLQSDSASVFAYLEAATCGFLGVYILSFVAELSFMSKTKEEQIVITAEAEAEEDKTADAEPETEKSETVVAVNVENEDAPAAETTAVEDEMNSEMKKFYENISDVELEIEAEEEETAEVDHTLEEAPKAKDYGSYFDTEEADDMYIETENIAVDTTKKHFADDSKYPLTDNETVLQSAVRDEYVVGLDEVSDEATPVVKEFETTDNKSVDSKVTEANYEARLDEIDRLIISIQGGESEE